MFCTLILLYPFQQSALCGNSWLYEHHGFSKETRKLDGPDNCYNFPQWNESKSIHSHGNACTLTKITLAGKYAGAVLVLPALVSH